MERISNKLSNLFGCTGCLFPICGLIFLASALLNGGAWGEGIIGVVLILVAIPLFAKAQKLEEARLTQQREDLGSIKPPEGNLDNTLTYISCDALTRVTIHEESRQLFCWRALDDLGKPLTQAKVNMTYTLEQYGFDDVLSAAIVENSDVINMSYISTNIPLQEYIKQQITSKLPNDIKSNKVHTLALVIQFRAVGNPFYQVNFIKDKFMDIETNSPEYDDLLNVLELWGTALTNIINNQPFQEAVRPVNVTIKKQSTAPKVDMNLISRPQDNGAKVLGKMDISNPTNERKVSKPAISPSTNEIINEASPINKTVKQLAEADETPVEPKELSYFEKLVAENKRQLAKKGANEVSETNSEETRK